MVAPRLFIICCFAATAIAFVFGVAHQNAHRVRETRRFEAEKGVAEEAAAAARESAAGLEAVEKAADNWRRAAKLEEEEAKTLANSPRYRLPLQTFSVPDTQLLFREQQFRLQADVARYNGVAAAASAAVTPPRPWSHERIWAITMAAPSLVGCVVLAVRNLISRRREATRLLAGCCVACGYDLRFSPDRCPECGRISPNRRTSMLMSRPPLALVRRAGGSRSATTRSRRLG